MRRRVRTAARARAGDSGTRRAGTGALRRNAGDSPPRQARTHMTAAFMRNIA